MAFKVVCPGCGKEVATLDFGTDELSRKEWEISHLCQECQDKVFDDTLLLI
jgi:hypothetical protein